MIQKVFASQDNMATFICPQCEKPRRADVSKFGNLDQAVRINVKCPCGHKYQVDLERRQHIRKAVNFPGIVFRIVDGMKSARRTMTVTDLSRSGMRLRVNQQHDFATDDTLFVEFRLDNAQRSAIRREAIVWRVSGLDISTKFTAISPRDPNDQALGFYFMS